jgi:CRP-like cAMP-binding protein
MARRLHLSTRGTFVRYPRCDVTRTARKLALMLPNATRPTRECRLADLELGHVTGNRLLDGLPDSDLMLLRRSLDVVVLEPKQFFLPAHEPLEYVYFPCDGLVSLSVSVREGRDVQAASVGRDGMLGVSVIFEANRPPFEMSCLVAGEALRMPTIAFARRLQELPGLATRMRHYGHGLFNETVRTAGCNGIHTVAERLARCLLLARDRLNSDRFPLTHDALAHMLGVTRPFVTRTISRFASEGLVSHERGTMHLMDLAGLERRVCEDYLAIQAEYARLLSPTGAPRYMRRLTAHEPDELRRLG